ncbi:MAG: folylpolyglutamate synthase/dihydrofolate synthase family protein [Bacteroidota bacterium]
MTYAETLDYLFSRLPMYQRQGAPAMKKDLGNTHALLEGLGRPERQLRAIHVGGTNGKGSVSHLLAAALQQDGKRVGVYTSPHYQDFRERIKINTELLPESWVVQFVAEQRALIEEVQPSFFEITVAMAFSYFAEQEVDWAVIEVGLGGRLDSTNVIDPVLSVITNISLDHTQFLGNTLPLIAGEKAGIIKAGRPVVIGQTQEATTAVFRRKAHEQGALILFADQHWEVSFQADEGEHTVYTIEQSGLHFRLQLRVQIGGPFQAYNVVTALAALHQLQAMGAWQLDYQQLAENWLQLSERTYFIGRWQQLQQQPLLLVDSAHNEAGLSSSIGRLSSLEGGQRHLVLGFVNDKDLAKVLPLFPKGAKYYWVKAAIPRALASEDLCTSAGGYGLHGNTYPSVEAGLTAALQAAQPQDIIYGGGSIFVVGEILTAHASS